MLNHRRHALRALPLLLPLLVLRALLPAGYMPANSDGDLRLVLCSAGLMPASHGEHAGHGGTGDNQQPPPAGTDCPFAQTTTAAPVPHFVALGAMAPAATLAPRVWTLELPPATGPPRTHGARAPPVPAEEA